MTDKSNRSYYTQTLDAAVVKETLAKWWSAENGTDITPADIHFTSDCSHNGVDIYAETKAGVKVGFKLSRSQICAVIANEQNVGVGDVSLFTTGDGNAWEAPTRVSFSRVTINRPFNLG